MLMYQCQWASLYIVYRRVLSSLVDPLKAISQCDYFDLYPSADSQDEDERHDTEVHDDSNSS